MAFVRILRIKCGKFGVELIRLSLLHLGFFVGFVGDRFVLKHKAAVIVVFHDCIEQNLPEGFYLKALLSVLPHPKDQ